LTHFLIEANTKDDKPDMLMAALLSRELRGLTRVLLSASLQFGEIHGELQSAMTAKLIHETQPAENPAENSHEHAPLLDPRCQAELRKVTSAMREFRDQQAHLETCLATLASYATDGTSGGAALNHTPFAGPVASFGGGGVEALPSFAVPGSSLRLEGTTKNLGNDKVEHNGKGHPHQTPDTLALRSTSPTTIFVAPPMATNVSYNSRGNSGRRSTAIGQYYDRSTDVERSVFITGLPSNWSHVNCEEIVSRFGAPRIFERVRLSKHSRVGELAVFKTKSQALHVQALLDHMKINKYRVSAGPPPIWLQRQRNQTAQEDSEDAKKNRQVLMELLAPWMLLAYASTGTIQRTWLRHKSLFVRITLGYFYPLLVQILMLFCMYACGDEVIRGLNSDQVRTSAVLRYVVIGGFIATTLITNWANAKEFLRPLSDNSLIRMMALNVRPGSSDVAYVRRTVSVLNWKGGAGLLLWIPFPLFCLWREDGGDGSSLFVAQSPTPRLCLISMGLVVCCGNVHVMFSRTALYSLVTRCVKNFP
jgi:hypothetical protein